MRLVIPIPTRVITVARWVPFDRLSPSSLKVNVHTRKIQGRRMERTKPKD